MFEFQDDSNITNASSAWQLMSETNVKGMARNPIEISLKCVGIVLNSLCLRIWSRPDMRNKPGFIFWITLSGYDLVRLLVSLTMNLFIDVGDLKTTHYFVLELFLFAGKFWSTYTTAALSADRAFAVSMPLRWRRLSSRRNNITIAVVIFVLGWLDRVPLLLRIMFPSTTEDFDRMYNSLSLAFNHAVPVIVILVTNIIVALKVNKRRRHIARRDSIIAVYKVTARGKKSRLLRHIPSRENMAVYKVTAQVFVISVFTIFTQAILFALGLFVAPLVSQNPEHFTSQHFATIKLLLELYRISTTLNISVNFIVYTCFCKSFRRELVNLLYFWK